MSVKESVIEYCCVGKETPGSNVGYEIAVEYPKSKNLKGNMATIIKLLLDKIPHRDDMKIITDRENKYFYSVSEGKVVLCVANLEVRRRIAFTLLERVLHEEITQPSELKQLVKVANDPKADRISYASQMLDDVKTQMIENIDKVLERGNNLDQLLDSTNDIVVSSRTFRGGTRKLKRRMRLQLCLLISFLLFFICIAVSIIVVVFVLLSCALIPSAGGCGLFKKKETR